MAPEDDRRDLRGPPDGGPRRGATRSPCVISAGRVGGRRSSAPRTSAPRDRLLAWFLFGDPVLGLLSFVLIRWRHRRPALVAAVLTRVRLRLGVERRTGRRGSSARSPRTGGGACSRVVVPRQPAGRRRAGAHRDRRERPAAVGVDRLRCSWSSASSVATGYAMGSQRELVDSYRDRAVTAEREQRARVAQAQAAERTRIAREMHDVLAHRISLVAMNASTLSYRTDLTAGGAGDGARSIEENAHRALSRPARGARRAARPDPARRRRARAAPAGHRRRRRRWWPRRRRAGCAYASPTGSRTTMPRPPGATAYRIVQEALTNVRKHAPGTTVTVDLAGVPEDGLVVAVRNAAPVGPPPVAARCRPPGSGFSGWPSGPRSPGADQPRRRHHRRLRRAGMDTVGRREHHRRLRAGPPPSRSPSSTTTRWCARRSAMMLGGSSGIRVVGRGGRRRGGAAGSCRRRAPTWC